MNITDFDEFQLLKLSNLITMKLLKKKLFPLAAMFWVNSNSLPILEENYASITANNEYT